MLSIKLSLSPIFWIFCLIWSPLPSFSGVLLSFLDNPQPHEHFQHDANVAEPILRFSFAQFLVNPCGLMQLPVSNDDDDDEGIIAAANEAKIAAVDADLSEESLKLLDSFRHLYNVNHSLFSIDERFVTIDEFLHIVEEAKDHAILSTHELVENIPDCDYIQFVSLPDIDGLVNEKGELEVKEVYRALAFTAVHLHLMSRHHQAAFEKDEEAAPRHRPCRSMENFSYQQNVRIFTGKVERLMCLIFPIWTSPSSVAGELFQVMNSVLLTHVHHDYRDCSSREIHRCLTLRFSNRVFDFAHQLGISQRLQLERNREEDYRREYCSVDTVEAELFQLQDKN